MGKQKVGANQNPEQFLHTPLLHFLYLCSHETHFFFLIVLLAANHRIGSSIKGTNKRSGRMEIPEEESVSRKRDTSSSRKSGESNPSDPKKQCMGLLVSPPAVKQSRSTENSDDSTAEWNQMFFEMMHYKAQYGTFNVIFRRHPALVRWMQRQKQEYKLFQSTPEASTLSQKQYKVLDSLHFPFNARGEGHWWKQYQNLKQFKEQHGHLIIPADCDVPGLVDWVRLNPMLRF